MALSSMTGFARGHGVNGTYSWAWELKSVNAKGLDLRLRLTPGWDAVEGPARNSAAQVLARGSPCHVGDRLPLTVGAAGHVILAFSGLTGERYDQIRKNMYAASFGERDPETAAVACPVFGTEQKFIGALSVSGPRYRIEAMGVQSILPVLFRQARNLCRVLGGDPDAPQYAAWSKPVKALRAAHPAGAAKGYRAASGARAGR